MSSVASDKAHMAAGGEANELLQINFKDQLSQDIPMELGKTSDDESMDVDENNKTVIQNESQRTFQATQAETQESKVENCVNGKDVLTNARTNASSRDRINHPKAESEDTVDEQACVEQNSSNSLESRTKPSKDVGDETEENTNASKKKKFVDKPFKPHALSKKTTELLSIEKSATSVLSLKENDAAPDVENASLNGMPKPKRGRKALSRTAFKSKPALTIKNSQGDGSYNLAKNETEAALNASKPQRDHSHDLAETLTKAVDTGEPKMNHYSNLSKTKTEASLADEPNMEDQNLNSDSKEVKFDEKPKESGEINSLTTVKMPTEHVSSTTDALESKSDVSSNADEVSPATPKSDTSPGKSSDDQSKSSENDGSTPYRSRYGRVQKKNSSPDMEFTPLVRKKRSRLSLKHKSDKNTLVENGEIMDSPSSTPQKLSPLVPPASPSTVTNPTTASSVTSSTISAPITTESSAVSPSSAVPSDAISPSSAVPSDAISPSSAVPSDAISPSSAVPSDAVTTTTSSSISSSTSNNIAEESKSSAAAQNPNDSLPTEWLVGDLLWSKITGYPWWPCMVSFDPLLGIYTRVRGTEKKTRSYHVQYFGPNTERSWAGSRTIMPFEGREKFEQWLAKMKNDGKRSRSGYNFEVKATKRKAWELAVDEAEIALKMTRSERKEKFTFQYFMPSQNDDSSVNTKHSKQPLKRKLEPLFASSEPQPKKAKESNNGCSASSNSVDVVKEESDNKEFRRNHVVKPKPRGSFYVFTQKHWAQTKMEHSELDDGEIQKVLEEMWDAMDEDGRSRYVGRFSENISQETGKKKTYKSKWNDSEDDLDDFVKESSNKVKKKRSRGDSSHSIKSEKDEVSDQMELSSSDTSSIQDLSEIDSFVPVSRSDKLCFICEETGDVISCTGSCLQTFHLKCLGLAQAPAEFVCDNCTAGKQICFSCKEVSEDVRKCCVSSCGKTYHLECLRKCPTARIDKRSFTCPQHLCQSCFVEDSKHMKSNKGRLLRCIRCPVAYHNGISCIAAGSVQLTTSHIICSRHFERKKSRYQTHVSAGWCFICSKGGSLICCESCPASFHAECLEIDPPEGNYYCEDCEAGKFPHYGDIIWVKLGTYRWWPGKVCHPDLVPDNIQNLAHGVGEFPVLFFGSRDYFWTHRGRVFHFQEGDSGSCYSNTNKHTEKVFKKALEEATEEYEKWLKRKELKKAQMIEKCSRPPPYRAIKANKPMGKIPQFVPNVSGLCRCDCEPTMENPCGPFSDCLNRVLMFECHPDLCPAGEHCQNQRFQRRQYVATECFKTDNRGWGLKTLEDVKKEQFVIEYVGELIDEEEYENRLKKMNETNNSNFYFLTIERDRIIDAGPKGNLARFMNHSCNPNCETQKWMVHGETRVGLFALHDIPAGSELTFNYNLDCRGNEKTPCTCGAENCSGFIGVRPKPPVVVQGKRKDLKRKKRKSSIQKHEDDCFRCGEGGELIMCGKRGCPKSYHLKCLTLLKRPHGKWDCPWHHCDVCGKQSSVLCSVCPNSFCKEHGVKENISCVSESFYACHEHSSNHVAILNGDRDKNSETNTDLDDEPLGSSESVVNCVNASGTNSNLEEEDT